MSHEHTSIRETKNIYNVSLPTATQQLLDNPNSGAENRFLNFLEERHRKLRITAPVQAELAIASEFYSGIFDVFAHLSMIKVMALFSEPDKIKSLASENPDLKYYINKAAGPRFIEQRRDYYPGSLHEFMEQGALLANIAVDTLTHDISQGSEQKYQVLWNMVGDAYEARNLIDKDFQRTNSKARLKPIFELPKPETADILKSALIENTQLALDIAIYHAVACMQNEAYLYLPYADSLSDSLQSMEDAYEAISSTNRQLVAELRVGRPLLNKINRARRRGESVDLPKTPTTVLSAYMWDKSAPDLFTGLSTEGNLQNISKGSLHPSLENKSWETTGNCGGRRPLIPREQDGSIVTQFARITRQPIPEAFSAARIMLRVGNELARETIYADPAAREGIEKISYYLGGSQ